LKFFDDVVVREEIYKLHLKRRKILDEIKKLDLVKYQYERSAARRNSIFFNTAFIFFAA